MLVDGLLIAIVLLRLGDRMVVDFFAAAGGVLVADAIVGILVWLADTDV